jgi:hypothetical protein
VTGGGFTVADLLPGDLVVTEIMQNPLLVADGTGEWFEVWNASGLDVDLAGLVVSDLGTDTFTVAGSWVLPADGVVVFGASADPAANGGVPVDYVWSGFTLGNGDDEVVLSWGGVTFDVVAYDGGPGFPDPNGASMTLDPASTDAAANDDAANWCEASSAYGLGDRGTPGAANDACAAADGDGDGFVVGDDCDDGDASVYPGAPEVRGDGIDQDCDGVDLAYTYSFAVDIYDGLFVRDCYGCHIDGADGGFAMTGWASMVGQPSEDVPGMARIEPFDTANSYLWHKLNGTQGTVGGAGNRMPRGGPFWSAADLLILETWINEGAPNN